MMHALKRGARGLTAAALTTLALVGMAAPAASAHPVDVTEGTLTYLPSSKLIAKLTGLRLTLRGERLPVAGGGYSFHRLDDGGGGEILTAGDVVIAGEGKRVRLANPVLTVPPAAKGSLPTGGELSVLIGGERVPLATLGLAGYAPYSLYPGTPARGFGGIVAKLGPVAAELLNERFGVRAFRVGLPFGQLAVRCTIAEAGH
jgi:hypothetical protein